MFYLKKKLCLGASILYFVSYTFSVSGYLYADEPAESVVPEVELRALPALRWDGVCPRKAERCPASFQGTTPPLILISFDGFHPDYMNRGFTPTINKLSQCGTNARFMYPVFPSKTFPNHYSQVTGLNPPSHGIVDNSMYDPATREMFKIKQSESIQPYWFQKEPIWITLEKQGKRAACYYWPGSEVKINGSSPTYYMKYRARVTFEDRVDQVLAWLDLPTTSRPHLITMYVNQPDNAGHHYGTKSKQVNDALAKVDRMMERLYSGLQQRNLVNCVNVIIMSDHGMSDTSCKRVVDIQKYVDVSKLIVASAGPFTRLKPRGRYNKTLINEVVSKLKCRSPNMRVYPKEQLPVRMHYADSARIEPIFVDLDAGWTVVSKSAGPTDSICSGGAHGYDNMDPDMRAIFMALGPSFKRNYTTRPFISTEVYEMMTELLGIKPNPNNGTKGSMHHIMTSPHALPPQKKRDPPATGVVPSDETERKFRVYASNCSCGQNQKQTQEQNIQSIHDLHLPFGVPYSPQDNSTLRLLYNKDYITAFDLKYRIPMWSAFTLKGQINVSKVSDICWKGDARIPIKDAANCGDYNSAIVKKHFILQRPLYPPVFSNSSIRDEATYITNSIPKSLNHSKILEKPLNEILAKWASQSREINVITGPAFDLLATGIRPPIGRIMRNHEQSGPLVVPTHIFVIATWCSNKKTNLKDCNPSKLDAHGFLLPNHPYPNNCESATSVIRRNVARVVDIEKLTDLSFYTGLPIYDAIRLRTIMPERTL